MRKSERRKTAAARQATTKPAEAQPAQWRTTQETLIIAQISRTKLHKATKAGTFPRPIKIGKKCVWIDSEIKKWMGR
ncbi:helix-turn-helix transcriptional regulator [Thiolapillus sp.]|uniref:helix-turn-helix transcriptional regulator n=1 Tax=Thiolapillus sp. TaxID=2017437 RepID=UPI003AF9EF4E